MINPGTRIGPYEIAGSIGAGGMGEVYRARDTRLNRDVAIKMLPDAFACDPDRIARFSREAQTLASLNHPHIAQIYGVEESADAPALVMELVDGETLADRIARGPLPLDEALPIARQIADALEAAHEHGIIHRDLKPANVKVRDDGTVKVLDFGLAKALDTAATSSIEALNSPTMTMRATQMGLVLGTAAYMAPEQAKGKRVDRRADIWAFGAVLYEMLSGKRPFDGDDVSDTLAAVLRHEIDWNGLPASTPPALTHLVQRCLERDVRRRLTLGGHSRYPVWSGDGLRVVYQSDREGDLALYSQLADGSGSAERLTKPAAGEAHFPEHWSRASNTLLFTVVKGAEHTLWTLTAADRKIARVEGVRAGIPINPMFSPDGRWIVYQSDESGRPTIYARSLTGAVYPLAPRTTDQPHEPVWSPDGKEVFYNPRAGGFEAVSVTTEPEFAIGNPVPVKRPFQLAPPQARRSYDVTPDGSFVALIVPGGNEASHGGEFEVVTNWYEELKRRVQ